MATEEQVKELKEKLDKEAEESGYHINPDEKLVDDLAKGLLVNEERYGYQACPCRLAIGKREKDLDIICPCDYRDPDLSDYGTCFCALYVKSEIKSGKEKAKSIPDRRKLKRSDEKKKMEENKIAEEKKYPVWRCKVCGYLCARDEPPETCPICKVPKDRFERFM